MESSHASAPRQGNLPGTAPTPDYGTLGPGPAGAGPSSDATPRDVSISRVAPLLAITMGIALAVAVGTVGARHIVSPRVGESSRRALIREPGAVSAGDPHLDDMKPQKQAEALLELAVARSDGAVDQISSRVDRWQGKLNWDSQMANLTAAALNSNDMRVRESGIEVELAAYGLAKNSASLDYLLKTAESSDHAQKIWALWTLGLMGNRGVGTEQVVQVLTAHMKDSDEDSRYWVVEGLALLGGSETIPLLLAVMHDDPSALVREAAACGIAQSGMFTHEQRLSAVPQLLNYTDDPALDTQTHGWAFQALAEITGAHLPNDSTAWRSWYENRN